MLIFGRKKRLEKELQEQRDLVIQKERQEQDLLLQKQQQEEEYHWKQQQIANQLRRAEQLLIQERRARESQQREEQARQLREQERLKKEQWEAEQKEREQRRREQRRQERLRLTTPEALHGLRDLVRTRYALDIEIWSLKRARGPDRPIVEIMMERADAVLTEIYRMVDTWDENNNLWSRQEWELARDVKERIFADGKRWWKNNPPWNDD
jgi:hypothetical protein